MSQEPAAASCSIATVNSHSFRPEDPLKVVPLLALSSLNSLLPTLALSLPLCLARSLFLSLPPPTLALSLSLSLPPPPPPHACFAHAPVIVQDLLTPSYLRSSSFGTSTAASPTPSWAPKMVPSAPRPQDNRHQQATLSCPIEPAAALYDPSPPYPQEANHPSVPRQYPNKHKLGQSEEAMAA